MEIMDIQAKLDNKEQLVHLVLLINLVLIGQVEQAQWIMNGILLLMVMDYGLLLVILVQEIG
jgi:hypothetical protein